MLHMDGDGSLTMKIAAKERKERTDAPIMIDIWIERFDSRQVD